MLYKKTANNKIKKEIKMKRQILFFILIANYANWTHPMMMPKVPVIAKAPFAAKTTPATTSVISIPLAYDVRIMNTSPIPGTLTSVTIAYGINGQTFATKKSIPNGQNTIPANEIETLLNHQNMLSFSASINISSSEASAAATFQGITAIEVNGQELNLTKAALSNQFGSSIIYIANIAKPGQTPIWKLTTAPVTPPAPREPVKLPPVTKPIVHTVGTNGALQAAAVPLIKLAQPKTVTMPMPPAPKMVMPTAIKPQPSVSLASSASKKAIHQIKASTPA